MPLKALQKLTDVEFGSNGVLHTSAVVQWQVAKMLSFLNTGYTGAGGFEIYVWNKDARKMWDAIFEAGKEFDIMPVRTWCERYLTFRKRFLLVW
jgi:aminomethyltransferase